MIVHTNKLIKEKNKYRDYLILSQIHFPYKLLNKDKVLPKTSMFLLNNTKLTIKENIFCLQSVKFVDHISIIIANSGCLFKDQILLEKEIT